MVTYGYTRLRRRESGTKGEERLYAAGILGRGGAGSAGERGTGGSAGFEPQSHLRSRSRRLA